MAKTGRKGFTKKQLINISVALLAVFLLGFRIYSDLYPTSPVFDVFSYTDDEVILHAAAFKRASDGDTIVVVMDGQEMTVRLIGVDAPESTRCTVQDCTDEGKKAYEYTSGYFKLGQTIYLEFDKGQKDKYGRTLAYIWTSNTCKFNDFNEFKKYNFNALLLQNTQSRARYYSPNGKYRKWFNRIDRMKYLYEE